MPSNPPPPPPPPPPSLNLSSVVLRKESAQFWTHYHRRGVLAGVWAVVCHHSRGSCRDLFHHALLPQVQGEYPPNTLPPLHTHAHTSFPTRTSGVCREDGRLTSNWSSFLSSSSCCVSGVPSLIWKPIPPTNHYIMAHTSPTY